MDLYQNRRFADAAHELGSYLKEHPEDFQARMLLGLSLQQIGKLDQAAEEIARAVKQRPRDAMATFSLARVRFLQGRFAEATKLCEVAKQLGASAASVLHLRGLILKEQHEDEQALQQFAAARKADAHFVPAYLGSAEILLKQDRQSAALPLIDAAIAQRASADAYYLRARVYLAMDEREKAAADLRKCIELGGVPQAASLAARLRSGSWTAVKEPGDVSSVRFEEIGGVEFVLANSPSKEKHLIETMAGGVATFDFDGDGRIDIFFTNGADIPSFRKTKPAQWNRLFRNEGGLKFRDVTEEMGVSGDGFSTGVTVGDFNGDGRPDLFVAGYGKSLLYRNDGKRFVEVSDAAGLKQQTWPIAAGWFDYDNDGDLDLFIVNYLDWSPAKNLFCGDPKFNFRVYCHPKHFAPLANVLYRNRGDGTFEDVSVRSGIAAALGKGMSVAFADYDGDGWQDIFVTNDAMPNFLFHNRRDGTFEEVGLKAGVALTDDGTTISSMGVDFRDYDNDGLPDLAVTALSGETFPLFRNLGSGNFADWSLRSGMTKVSHRLSGWGIHLADFNNDGWKDVFTANAHVTDNIETFSPDTYLLANSVFVNRGGSFEAANVGFTRKAAHRGSAMGDFDNDGRLDVVVSVLGGRAELWHNVSAPQHWLDVRTDGAVVIADRQWNFVSSTAGYASSSSIPVHFGLGKRSTVEKLTVRWLDGSTRVMENVAADRMIEIKK